jgi:hypothetical protein
LSYQYKSPYLALGILARPGQFSKTEEGTSIDSASGFLSNGAYALLSQEKTFAVFEAEYVKLSDPRTRWHMEGKNLALRLYNSFIGGEATIGFAFVLGGLHVIWKEKEEDDGDRYNFHTLDREFNEIETAEELNFFTKIFIHVARICSTFYDFEYVNALVATANFDLKNNSTEELTFSEDESNFSETTYHDDERIITETCSPIQTTQNPAVISWMQVVNPTGDEDLVFGAVELSKFLSEQGIEDLMAQEEKHEDGLYVVY